VTYHDAMALADPAVHRLTTAEFERMVDSGALAGMPVELIDGLLLDVTAQGAEHADTIVALQRLLAARIELLRIQLPLACAEGWTPEPDVAVVAEPARGEHPRTARLVCEVMVGAHVEARRKLPGYAMAGVPLVWLVDVPARAVEELREPASEGFRTRRVLRGDDVLDSHVEGLAPFTVAQLLALAGV
jgi:Uma2 family endonuclease